MKRTYHYLLFLSFLVVCLLGSPPVRGQYAGTIPTEDTRPNTIGLSLGLTRLRMQDQHVSGLVYSGKLPTLGIDYRHRGPKGYFVGSFRAGRGSFFPERYPGRTITFLQEGIDGQVDSVSVPVRGTSTLGRVDLGYLRRLNPGSPLEWAAGAVASEEIHYQEGFVTPGLLNTASLGPAIQAAWQSDGALVAAVRLTVPLVSLVTRSTYPLTVSEPEGGKLDGFFSQGTAIRTPGKLHFQGSVSASLGYRLNSRWAMGLNYRLAVVKNQIPATLTVLQQNLSLSLEHTY